MKKRLIKILFIISIFFFLSCEKIVYTVEIKPIKYSPEMDIVTVKELNKYLNNEIKAIRKLKHIKMNADKIIETELYIKGNKTHIDLRLIDSKTKVIEYENNRFWKEPKIYDLRFLIKKIFVDMELNHFKWNRGLMK